MPPTRPPGAPGSASSTAKPQPVPALRSARRGRACRARSEREFRLKVLNVLPADSARALWELATGEDGFLLGLKADPGPGLPRPRPDALV